MITDLGTLPGDDRGYTVTIKELGQIVGWSGAVSPWDGHAFLWNGHGKMIDLGTLQGGRESEAAAINNRSQIAGWSTTKSGSFHAVLWALKRD